MSANLTQHPHNIARLNSVRAGLKPALTEFGPATTPPGRFQTCPYIGLPNTTLIRQHNDSVNVIRHYDKCVAFDTGIMIRQLVPHRLNEATSIV